MLHTFGNSPDGAFPTAPPILDAQGNLYGTTSEGGTIGFGTVYKLTPSGDESVIHSIQGGPDGALPNAALIQDSEGNFYGNTLGLGTFSGPTVFKIDPRGKETILYDFNAHHGDHGCCQDSPLAIDKAGNLYGMFPYGGDSNVCSNAGSAAGYSTN